MIHTLQRKIMVIYKLTHVFKGNHVKCMQDENITSIFAKMGLCLVHYNKKKLHEWEF